MKHPPEVIIEALVSFAPTFVQERMWETAKPYG
jgi:hypothetical protein